MSDVPHEASTFGQDGDFPRFLNRDRAGDEAQPTPPPLPRAPWRHGVAIARFAIAGMTALGGLAIAAAPVLTAKREPVPPLVRASVSPVAPQYVVHDQVAEAVDVVAAFEMRLGFGTNLATISASPTPAPASASHHDTLQAAESSSLAAMMRHGELDSASVVTAAKDGQSVWVSSSIDSGDMVMALGGGEPALTDAESLALSSLANSNFAHSSLAPTDTSQIDAAHQRAAADGETPSHPPAHPQASASADVRDADDEGQAARPVKRRPRVHVRKVTTVAHNEPRLKRRVRRDDDAYKARNRQPSTSGGADSASASSGTDPEVEAQDKPSGPISKFFAWLKGGAKKTDADDGEKPSALGLSPQD